MRCRRVDLPEPDGPVIATHSPRATLRFVPSSARTPAPGYSLETWNVSIAGGIVDSLIIRDGGLRGA